MRTCFVVPAAVSNRSTVAFRDDSQRAYCAGRASWNNNNNTSVIRDWPKLQLHKFVNKTSPTCRWRGQLSLHDRRPSSPAEDLLGCNKRSRSSSLLSWQEQRETYFSLQQQYSSSSIVPPISSTCSEEGIMPVPYYYVQQ